MKFFCYTAIDGRVTATTTVDTPLAIVTIDMSWWQRLAFLLLTKGRVQLAIQAESVSDKTAIETFCKEYTDNVGTVNTTNT